MYGKGKSANPSVAYDRDLFKGQLLDLLERLGVKDPVHLVGFSFGGATATNFTAAHPDKVRTLALIAPVFRFEEGNTLVRTARIPLVGELFMRFVVMKKGADRASRLWSGAEGAERYAALFRNQLSRPGFEQAFLSFLRSDALGDYSAAYRSLGQAGRKALLIWGTSDEDIPAAHIEQIRNSFLSPNTTNSPESAMAQCFRRPRASMRCCSGICSIGQSLRVDAVVAVH